MKLVKFIHNVNYVFTLFFDDKKKKEVDLQKLIGKYVSVNELVTAHINTEWGCLEFNAGQVDIEPKTLYHYTFSDTQSNK
ncbi:MAG: DUF2442 domain-containing protein [Methyloprofundus sp.]|nr:DUF2442 domain-containing protein [Methyloprofundus sp.]